MICALAVINAPNAMASPSLSNSTKATKAIGGIREEEQRREHQVLQISPRSRAKGIPSQRGDIDW